MKNIQRPIIRTISVVALSAVLAGTSITTASASTPAASAADIADYLAKAESASVDVMAESPLRDGLLDVALADPEIRGVDDAQLTAPQVIDLGSSYVVRSDIRAVGVDPMSSYSVMLDAGGRVQGTMEYLLRGDGLGGGRIDVWKDGVLSHSAFISATQAEAVASGVDQQVDAGPGFWSKLNSCLAAQGVASWALALIAGACALACVVTAGAACILCIGTTIGFPAGVVGNCVRIASS